jgi:hypothetical protein
MLSKRHRELQSQYQVGKQVCLRFVSLKEVGPTTFLHALVIVALDNKVTYYKRVVSSIYESFLYYMYNFVT